MKARVVAALCSMALIASPLLAQDDDGGGEIIVTATRISGSGQAIAVQKPPVIGFRRLADSAIRNIEIVSDSRDEDMRKREVQAMLLAAIDRAKSSGFSLVTGQLEVVEVTRANWKDQFPGLASSSDDEDDESFDDDDEDEDDQPKPSFEDDGSDAIVRLKVKTKLAGSIDDAQKKIASFVRSVPVTGRSQIRQKGGLALTIIKPEQYRDEIYRRIAVGAKHAATFYGPEFSVDVTGLDNEVAWKQVSNTELFLYISYTFTVSK